MAIQIAPSILAADFLELGKQIKDVSKTADIIHFDVMDGSFVPNISFGFPVLDAVKKIVTIPLDVHLMIVHPEKYFKRCADSGANMLSFHLEAALEEGNDPAELLDTVHSLGMKAGLAFNPDFPIEKVYPYLDKADYVLAMSVFAGFGGQNIEASVYDRVRALKKEIARRGSECLVEIDGGVTRDNIAAIAAAGVDIVVAGSAVFKADDCAAEVQVLREIARG